MSRARRLGLALLKVERKYMSSNLFIRLIADVQLSRADLMFLAYLISQPKRLIDFKQDAVAIDLQMRRETVNQIIKKLEGLNYITTQSMGYVTAPKLIKLTERINNG